MTPRGENNGNARRGWLDAVRRAVGRAPLGVADQAAISACNLGVTVLLARKLSQHDFGLFALAYSVLLLSNSIQAGLITQPHNLLGPRLKGDAYRRYTASVTLAQLGLCAAFALLTAGAWGVFAAMGWSLAPLLLALLPTIPAWQLQEHVRRVFYTEGRIGRALTCDVLTYGGQLAGVAALWWTSELTATRALWVVAAANAAGAAIGLAWMRASLAWPGAWADVRENWRVGKWLVGTELAGTWLCDGLLVYLAAAILGPTAAGIIRGVHTLFGPVRILIQAVHVMLPISLARALDDSGENALRAQTRTAFATAVPAFVLFCLVIELWPGGLLAFAYGPEWASATGVLRLYALAIMLNYLGAIFASALKAAQDTRAVFYNRLSAGVIGLIIGSGATIVFNDVRATVAGMIVSTGLLLVFNGRRYARLTAPPRGNVATEAAI